MILGVDVSRYDEQVEWDVLAEGGAGFAIVKVSQGDYLRDPMAEQHLRGANSVGLETGIYHWCDPSRGDREQAEYLLKAAKRQHFTFIALDVEQHWSRWDGWPFVPATQQVRGDARKALLEKRAGRRKPERSKRSFAPENCSPQRISENVRAVAKILEEECGRKPVIYTRTSFIQEYARTMLAWLPEYPLWLAQYPGGTRPAECSWEALWAEHAPLGQPALPPGCKLWHFWQWSGDRFKLPGASSRLDLNFFNGSREELAAFCAGEAGHG
jgi:GH25 family lysozyme M1 (1,4-beta-N-acetylmuramidase)